MPAGQDGSRRCIWLAKWPSRVCAGRHGAPARDPSAARPDPLPPCPGARPHPRTAARRKTARGRPDQDLIGAVGTARGHRAANDARLDRPTARSAYAGPAGQGRARKKTAQLEEALRGFFTDHHAAILRMMLDNTDRSTPRSPCSMPASQPFNVSADTGEDQRRTADAADIHHQHPGGGPEKQRQQRRRDQCKTRPADPLQESADHHRECDCRGDGERQRSTLDTVVQGDTHDD